MTRVENQEPFLLLSLYVHLLILDHHGSSRKMAVVHLEEAGGNWQLLVFNHNGCTYTWFRNDSWPALERVSVNRSAAFSISQLDCSDFLAFSTAFFFASLFNTYESQTSLWCLERWLVKAPTPETSVILIQYSSTSLTLLDAGGGIKRPLSYFRWGAFYAPPPLP